jgi:hypothetical protein
MKRIGHERFGAGKVSVAAHVDNNRRRFGAEPCVQDFW